MFFCHWINFVPDIDDDRCNDDTDTGEQVTKDMKGSCLYLQILLFCWFFVFVIIQKRCFIVSTCLVFFVDMVVVMVVFMWG